MPKIPGRILLVEDEAPIRKALLDKLIRSGLSVDGAADAKEAMDLLRQNHYDLMLLDIILPGKNGVVFLQELRDIRDYARLPVLVITNLSLETDEITAVKSMGVVEVLIKSDYGLTEIMSKIKHFLQMAKDLMENPVAKPATKARKAAKKAAKRTDAKPRAKRAKPRAPSRPRRQNQPSRQSGKRKIKPS